MTATIDEAGEVKPGQELDVPSLQAFLRSELLELEGELRVRQFPGGHSNLSYLLVFDNRELVLRRPPFGTVAATAHDMAREHTVLEALSPVFPLAPAPVVYSEHDSIIGCPFYVMEKVEGVIIRRELPQGM
jgi:aminoglycoside phosphotransferase (APT) family kinase protein